MSERRRAWRIWLAAGFVLVVALLIIADSTVGMRPTACAVCHTDVVRAQAEGAHAGSPCLSCHLESGWWSAPGFKVQQWTVMYPRHLADLPVRPAREVSREACESCHEAMGADGITQRSGLRVDHTACAAPPLKCDSCHGGTSHGQAVRWGQQMDMDACVNCHVEQGAPRACDTCHEGRLEIERLRRGVWRVTHGPTWRSTHSMGTYSACITCHEQGFCIRCHEVPLPHPLSFGSAHGRLALDDRTACESCHGIDTFCDGCHGIEMPHPTWYLQAHTGVTQEQIDGVCVTCHENKACTECHARHEAHPDETEMQLFRDGLR